MTNRITFGPRVLLPCLWSLVATVDCAALSFSGKNEKAGCRIDEAQRRLADAPRDDSAITRLLASCTRIAPDDYRPWMITGVMARDAGHLEHAIAALESARARAPREVSPRLELALAYERAGRLDDARSLYAALLGEDASNRAARLGQARVARAQHRPDIARSIYMDLLERNPDDTGAAAGLAWLALDRKDAADARARFQALLKGDPDHSDTPEHREAREGLAMADKLWRYQLDVATTHYGLAAGSTVGAATQLQVALNGTDTVAIGFSRNARELVTSNVNDPTPLPSDQFRIGFSRQVPGQSYWGLAYEYRRREHLATENRIEWQLGAHLSPSLQWFGGVRESFPSLWRNRLYFSGMTLALRPAWSMSATAYYGQNKTVANSKALLLSLTHERADRLLYSIGAGRSRHADSWIVYGRAVLPLPGNQALTAGIERRSLGGEIEAMLGWRMYWQ